MADWSGPKGWQRGRNAKSVETITGLHHLWLAVAVTTATRSLSSLSAIAAILNPPWRTAGNPSGSMLSTMSPSDLVMVIAEQIPNRQHLLPNLQSWQPQISNFAVDQHPIQRGEQIWFR
ncbi:hypothetical protein ACLOJK_004695 [Asimina triloba]